MKYNYNLTTKLNILSILYTFFDEFITGFEFVCKPGCNICCTVDIVCTTLEIQFLAKHLKIPKKLPTRYYRPSISINKSAQLYINKKIPPPENSDRSLIACPLLDKHGLCSIYPYRPFACRAMMSRTICQKDREADIHPFLVYVSLTFMQLIEHLDNEGHSANMWDFLTNNSKYFIKNQPFPGIIAPIEYRARIKSMIRRILNLELEDKKLSYYFNLTI